MSLDFLKHQGGRRMADYPVQPQFVNGMSRSTTIETDDEESAEEAAARRQAKIDLDYEASVAQWKARRVTDCGRWHAFDDWPLRPVRFIDGKDVGRTVAWLKTPEGYPVPVRLSVIGAIAMRNENGALRRDWHTVERVVTMATDAFPADQVGEWENDLAKKQFRLLSVVETEDELGYDFERTNARTRGRSHYEMNMLEKQAMQRDSVTPMLVDGLLERHSGGFDPETTPVLGLVKSHHQQYLEDQQNCWATLYGLEPGERTPCFIVKSSHWETVSWYVRLCGPNGEMPNWGVVRLELPKPFFETTARDFSVIDRYSQLVCEYRCRDEGYGRAAVSIHPIVRAEESLGACFPQLDTLVQKFYRMTGL